MRKILFLVFSLLLLSSVSAQQIRVGPTGDFGPKQHTGRVIVRFRGQAQLLDGSGPAKGLLPQLNLFVVDNPSGLSVAQAVARYKNNPNVLYAEPDYQVQAFDTPNDPMWANPGQWDMVKIAAPAAWTTQKDASDIVVAVIDTGIAYSHPDLAGNLWTDASGSLTGVAGSHGFTCMGSCVAGGADDFGHGSHVAGTIGAVGNNSLGMAGVNWGVKLLSMKFLDSNGGGYISDAVLAFNKIVDLKKAGVNVRVTNNSWGGGEFTQALKDAMKTAEGLGILDVCAAGNSGVNADAVPMYPAAYDNRGILSVAASDANDAGASFSNIGLATVDLAAPGVSTISTVPTGTCQYCMASGYNTLSGTSMATPHVSGVAAALFHLSPGSSAEKIRDVLLDPASFDRLTDARLSVTSTFGGRLNFAKAIANPQLSFPNAPLNGFPTLTPPIDVGAYGGALVQLSASASDPDNDSMTLGWAPLISGSAIFSAMLNSIFPTPPMNTNPVSFTAPSLARNAFARYTASVADRRGGSASGAANVQIFATGTHGQPSGDFSVSPHSVAVNGSVTLNFANLSDPDGQQPIYWQAWFLSSTVWGEMCCLSADNPTFNLPMSYAGAYRVSVQAINKALNLSPKYTDIVSVGGVTGTPPIASTSVDKLDGVAPLIVNINMSASSPGGSPLSSYVFYCPDGTKISSTPSGSCTFPTAGNYYLWTTVKDSSGLMDASKTYITVLPSTAPPPPPPAPDFTIGAGPSSNTVTAGSNAVYNVSITGQNSFTGQVTFSVSGLPSGAGSGFNPSSVTGGGPSTMTITTSSTTPAGTYPLTVTGTSVSLVHSTTVNLVVNAPAPPPPSGNFTISVSPSSMVTISRGGSTQYVVTIAGSGGFNSAVTVSVTGLPNGGSAKFAPSSVTGSGSFTVTINTSKGTKAGNYTLTFTGTSTIGSHSMPVVLKVQ